MRQERRNIQKLFRDESPEVAAAFDGLTQALSNMQALEPKMKELIYIAIRASQGETTAVTGHVPLAKRAGATREELKEAILMTITVCGIKGIASSLEAALEVYDQTESEKQDGER